MRSLMPLWLTGHGLLCILHVLQGVWDVMSNLDVVEFVRSRIADHMSPSLVSSSIL